MYLYFQDREFKNICSFILTKKKFSKIQLS